MKVTLLGTGTSSGVPVLTCGCPVCRSPNPKDKRLRASVLIETEQTSLVIDSGPDFRQQLLRVGLDRLDAILFTHEHKDHTAGLDDVRPFNYLHGKHVVNLYAHANVMEQLGREFHYAFTTDPYPGIPLVKAHTIDNEPFVIGDLPIQPIEVMHHELSVFGYRIHNFVYITDANFISDQEKIKLKNCNVLVLNALQKEPHISHFTLAEAIALAKEINAEKTYFTHISHKMGFHDAVNAELPKGMELASDGLNFEL